MGKSRGSGTEEWLPRGKEPMHCLAKNSKKVETSPGGAGLKNGSPGGKNQCIVWQKTVKKLKQVQRKRDEVWLLRGKEPTHHMVWQKTPKKLKTKTENYTGQSHSYQS